MGNIITFIKKYYGFILFVLVVVLTVFLFQSWSTLRKERQDRAFQEKINSQNVSAITDSITVNFNKKLQAWEYSKDNYVVQKLSDLEKYNKSLASDLEKVKGDIISVIQSKVQADLGGITTKNDSVVTLDIATNHYGLKFNSQYSDAGFQQQLIGMNKFYVVPNSATKNWTITPDVTEFSTNLTTIGITYGFKELENKYQVFALSKSDKVKLTDVTGGYFIDKQIVPPTKKKKFGIGPYIGGGLNTDPNLANPRFGWSIGFGLHYNIIQW